MKKLLTLFVALVMSFTLVFTGCGGGGGTSQGESESNTGSRPSSGKTTISFAGRGSVAEENNYTKFINDFMAENEDIYVSIDWSADEGSYGLALSGSKNLPDVFMMDDRDFLVYASAGRLYDMSSKVSEAELGTMFTSSYDKYYYNEDTKLLGPSDGAGLYGLPKDQGPYVLVYNKDLIKQCFEIIGETPVYPSATDPFTFETFVAYCQKLVNTETRKVLPNLFGIGAYELQAAVYSNNADFFNADATEQKITEQNFIDALQWIADLYLEYNIAPSADMQTTSNAYQRFIGGSALFCFAGPWDCTTFWSDLQFNWDICPVVVGTAQNAVSTAWIGSMAYSVSANSKNKEAAVKLAKYLAMDEDSQRTQYQIGQAIPNLKVMALNEFSNDTLGLLANKNGADHRSVWVDTVDGYGQTKTDADGNEYTDKVSGKARATYFTYGSDWLDGFMEYLNNQGFWDGRKTAEEVCNGYKNTMQAYLDGYQDDLDSI